MFFMPIPKLIHSFLHQFNSGTVKLVKIFFNYCIFFEYFAVNFFKKIRSGGWEYFFFQNISLIIFNNFNYDKLVVKTKFKGLKR